MRTSSPAPPSAPLPSFPPSPIETVTPAGLAEKKIGVTDHSDHATYLEQFYKSSEVQLYSKIEEANLDLLTGRLDAVFGDKLEDVNTSGHYMSKPLTLDRVRTLDRAKMVAFYKDRFSNAADFTFFMVGAFKTE